ncbi:MAG TPA: ABC transporter permease [Haliscomenobacter sp.]|uniref:ABC transporter permease n=1 Tax=Haliscomenobacter sp. TaxID=2717303 RepID=UPI002BE97A10|nr:ABC transporter permease [Haliscomenobacter sp.]HOY16368.1 ABC transporter permease [Haliscomenobacter sp.]
MFKLFLRIASRAFFKDRTSGLINIVGLSLGMTGALLIGMWVSNELSYDRYHDHAERIYRLKTHIKISDTETWHWNTVPLKFAGILGSQLAEIELISQATSGAGSATVKLKNQLIKVEHCATVDSSWFKLFKYEFIDGSQEAFFEHPKSVILNQSTARQFFGDADPIGQILRIDTNECVVQAIIKDAPLNSSFKFNLLLPLKLYLGDPNNFSNSNSWGNFNFNAYARLRPDTDAKKLGQKITRILRKEKNDSTIVATIEPLTEMRFDQSVMSGDEATTDFSTIRIFFIIGLLILIVACINYVNLSIARTSKRSKEIGMQKILGASKKQVFSQFMLESAAMCVVALVGTLLMARLSMPMFNQLTGEQFKLQLLDGSLWKIILIVLTLVILLTGVYPALLLSSFQPISIMKGSGFLSKHKTGFWKGLAVLQFAISVGLIVSTLTIYQQLQFVRNKNLGFDREYVMRLNFPWQMMRDLAGKGTVERMAREIENNPAVSGISMASADIVNHGSSSSGNFEWEGRKENENPTFAPFSADANFQKIFGLKLVEGRWFEESNKADESNFVLNETAVKICNLKSPVVGQRFEGNGIKGQIIGVVKDFHLRDMHEKIPPVVINGDPSWRTTLYVKTSGANASKVVDLAGGLWQSNIPNRIFEYHFLDDEFEKLYEKDQRTALMFNIFSVIAILISCLGLFALAAFTAERRTKEIGVRKVLGASVSGIIALLSKDFVIMVCIGIVIASPLAWYVMQQWLQNFAYRIDMQWWFFVVAGLMAMGIALLTVSIQALRAALVNPVQSLKSE